MKAMATGLSKPSSSNYRAHSVFKIPLDKRCVKFNHGCKASFTWREVRNEEC